MKPHLYGQLVYHKGWKFSSINAVGQTGYAHAGEYNWTFICNVSYAKINSRWIKNANIRPETIQILEET